jgi:acyl dehydratase
MKQKKVIFRDTEIVEFCRATLDTNEIHDPLFMAKLGKRVIVPGMFALSLTVNFSADFLKNHANSLKVLFNSLVSSGDFVTLCASSSDDDPSEIRLSAIKYRDTLTSNNEYTRLSVKETAFNTDHKGILRRLEVKPEQVGKFRQLIGAEDKDVAHFLFAVSYASQALIRSIDQPETEIEKEIDETINKNNTISPFYRSLDIRIPNPFPVFDPVGELDYFIHFEREKLRKLYGAYVRCEHHGKVIFHAHYKLVGIANRVILRMAKTIKRYHPA